MFGNEHWGYLLRDFIWWFVGELMFVFLLLRVNQKKNKKKKGGESQVLGNAKRVQQINLDNNLNDLWKEKMDKIGKLVTTCLEIFGIN